MPKGIRMGTVEDLQNRYPGATLIKNWDELREYAKEKGISKTHKLVMTEHAAHIETIDGHCCYRYLSTHAFDYFIDSTKMLQKSGFNVILDDWRLKTT